MKIQNATPGEIAVLFYDPYDFDFVFHEDVRRVLPGQFGQYDHKKGHFKLGIKHANEIVFGPLRIKPLAFSNNDDLIITGGSRLYAVTKRPGTQAPNEKAPTESVAEPQPSLPEAPVTDAPANRPPHVFQIGTGVDDVTDPAAGLVMQGFSLPEQKTAGILRVSDADHRPLDTSLRARAFIIDDGEQRITIAVADIWSGSNAIKTAVVRRLQAVHGERWFTMENVLICGTHTHSAPGGFLHYHLYNFAAGGFDASNFECIVSGIIGAINKAHASLGPGRIFVNKTQIADCGLNRSIEAYNNNDQAEKDRYQNKDTKEDLTTDTEMLQLHFVRLSGPPESEKQATRGVLNWYPIHPNSLKQENTKVSGDSKGYAAHWYERGMGTSIAASETFAAAFANSNCGDVSGNVAPGGGIDGTPDLERLVKFGDKQLNAARSLIRRDTVENLLLNEKELRRPIEFRHQFIDLPARTQTKGAVGLSLFAGSRHDGNPQSGLREGITNNGSVQVTERIMQALIGPLFSPSAWTWCPTWETFPEPEQIRHNPKPVVLATGVPLPPLLPLTPNIVPLQLLRVGGLAIAGVPAEVTTMAGRRLREAILKILDADGVTDVVLCCYANEYSSYVCTPQEYEMQYYEGASTLFGKGTLQAYIDGFSELAQQMLDRLTPPSSVAPPNLAKDVRALKRVTIRNYSDRAYELRFYDPDDLAAVLAMANSPGVVELPPYGEVAWSAPPSIEITLPLVHQRLVAVPSALDAVQVSFNDKNLTKVRVGGLVEIGRNYQISAGAYRPPARSIFWRPVADSGGLDGPDIAGTPAVFSWGPGHVGVVWRRADGAIFYRRLDDNSAAQQVGLRTFASRPAAVSRGPNRVDIFVRGDDNKLYFTSRESDPRGGFRWQPFKQLPGLGVLGDPSACVFGQDGLIVFSQDVSGNVYANILAGGQWRGWSFLSHHDSNFHPDSPTCFPATPNSVHLFNLDSSLKLTHRMTDGQTMFGWFQFDGRVWGPPAVCSSSAGLIDLFARGADDLPYHRRFTNGTWGNWILLGTNKLQREGLGACSPRANQIELFVRTPRGKLGRRAWNGVAWTP